MKTRPIDLFRYVSELSEQAWIERIYIFGSRRYPSNASFGSDIDLLIIPNATTSIDSLKVNNREPYVDAFLLTGNTATSCNNGTQILLGNETPEKKLDAKPLWTRSEDWVAGGDYRTLQIIPDRLPTTTIGNVGLVAVLVFCALKEEFKAVVKRLGNGKLLKLPDLPPQHVGEIICKTGTRRHVVVIQTGVASVSAAIAATRALNFWSQAELAVLVGITAGFKLSKLKLGDVLMPTSIIDVESGKKTPKGHEPAGLILPTSISHAQAMAAWPREDTWRFRWGKKSISGTEPTIHSDCALACSSSVIGYAAYAKEVRHRHRKALGVEMEALGVATACQNRCPFVVIKAISDWANSKKNDKWHKFCMDASADLAISLLKDEVI